MVSVFTPTRNPSPQYTTYDSEYSTFEAGFGDEYSQRTGAGINVDKSTCTLVWDNCPSSEFSTYKAFFDGLKGVTPFDYTLPLESTQKRWICTKTKITPIGNVYARFEAYLKRVYDL